MGQLLSRSDAAKILGIGTKTLMVWVKEGKIKDIRNDYNYAFFDKDEVFKLKEIIELSKPPVGHKFCSKCEQLKTIENFNKAGNICKPCTSILNKIRKPPELNRQLCKQYREKYPEKVKEHNDRTRFKKFGISQVELDKLMELANNKCQICGIDSVPLCIDHCHTTNKIRGMLCTKCNLAIANFNDNTIVIQNAINYLTEYKLQSYLEGV